MFLIYVHFESPWKEFIILEKKKWALKKGKAMKTWWSVQFKDKECELHIQLFLLADPCVCWHL